MINCIVAVDRHHGIGLNGNMPWPFLKEDMAWFKKLTTNNVVIMGSTTYISIGKPLSDRINVVVSKKSSHDVDHTFTDTATAIDYCSSKYPEKEIFIIGGESIYEQYLDIVDRFYVTEIDESYNCDRFFNLTYVKKHFKNIKEHGSFKTPVPFIIKEYNL